MDNIHSGLVAVILHKHAIYEISRLNFKNMPRVYQAQARVPGPKYINTIKARHTSFEVNSTCKGIGLPVIHLIMISDQNAAEPCYKRQVLEDVKPPDAAKRTPQLWQHSCMANFEHIPWPNQSLSSKPSSQQPQALQHCHFLVGKGGVFVDEVWQLCHGHRPKHPPDVLKKPLHQHILWAPSHLTKPSPNSALSIDYSRAFLLVEYPNPNQTCCNLHILAHQPSALQLSALCFFFGYWDMPPGPSSGDLHGGNSASSQSSRHFFQVFTARPPGGASENLQDFRRAQRSLPQLGRSQPPGSTHRQESALYIRNTHTRKTCTHLYALRKSFYSYSQAFPNLACSLLEKLLAR